MSIDKEDIIWVLALPFILIAMACAGAIMLFVWASFILYGGIIWAWDRLGDYEPMTEKEKKLYKKFFKDCC